MGNIGICESVLHKLITTHEEWIKYNFVAPGIIYVNRYKWYKFGVDDR